MNRVAVIGCSGAGKSTLARRLGERVDAPVIHLDQLFWRPGWQETPRGMFTQRVLEATRGDRWIVDGTYASTWHVVLPRADTVVFLDFPRVICLWRVIARYLAHRGRTRRDMTMNCPEKMDFEFAEYVWTFPSDYRPRIISRLAQCGPEQRILVLQSPTDVTRFWREIDREVAAERTEA